MTIPITSTNELRKRVFASPLLSDEEVIAHIKRLDYALYKAANSLWPGTSWFLQFFGELVQKTVFVSFRNQRMFATAVPRSKRPKIKGRQPSIEDLYSPDEQRFLLAINCAAMHVVAPDKVTPPKAESFRLFRRTLVECMEGFMSAVGADMTGQRPRAAYVRDVTTVANSVGMDGDRSATHATFTRVREAERLTGAVGGGLFCTTVEVLRHMAVFLALRSALCEPFLRKVWSVVRASNINQADQRFLALFNWGVTGLTTSVNCFEEERATSFGSFAEWWIRQRTLSYMKSKLNLVNQDPRHLQIRTRIRGLLRDRGWVSLTVNEQVQLLTAELDMPASEIVDHLIDDASLSGIMSIDTQFGDDDSKTSVGDMISGGHDVDDTGSVSDGRRTIEHLLRFMPYEDVRLYLLTKGREQDLLPLVTPNLKNLVRLSVHSVRSSRQVNGF